MIYALGLASDGTIAHFTAEAARRSVPVTLIDLHDVLSGGDWRLAVPDDGQSWLATAGQRYDLDADAAYYCRLIDLSSLEPDPGHALRWQSLVVALSAWLDHVPGTVVNRPGAGSDNGSKPLHEMNLHSLGFDVPESVTSSDRDRLRAFAAAGPTIVKALSGVRADSRLVGPADFDDFVPAQGPVHLQRYVRGSDIRAHVCGPDVYAEEIVSAAVDYRTAPAGQARYEPCDLPAELADRLVDRTRRLGLAFAGWDLKVDADRRHWCLEVNPMPGYDWYDRRLDGAVSAALLGLLTGEAA
ncbi:hypothetical protein Misp01_31960 [Microtetraspora sp. NBRC 13810]|uniref:ATP-grasp domain-containing protein n=1 Tax=Microtetraspora sp. NBRC 13810 TaxID=3030990 RepID=UPI0024A1519D|nr:hypothetical protein [Microtetraspora sp. NBRC 13810]GLW08066.1 hypothetical protein Misp01_31960 [Microtetraspora sp. NBRC 13810]